MLISTNMSFLQTPELDVLIDWKTCGNVGDNEVPGVGDGVCVCELECWGDSNTCYAELCENKTKGNPQVPRQSVSAALAAALLRRLETGAASSKLCLGSLRLAPSEQGQAGGHKGCYTSMTLSFQSALIMTVILTRQHYNDGPKQIAIHKKAAVSTRLR
ncbi:hypothetical protein MHYP_G00193560 [Metynnis hypsauchen]